ENEYRKLAEKLGEPRIDDGPDAGRPCELIILAMGKFGGRELNYYSDLDLVFLFEAEGMTAHHRRGKRSQPTSNQHFFSELGQRMEETAGPGNIKRGAGGLVDIEFLVQMLQLKHGRDNPAIQVPGTLAALSTLAKTNILAAEDAEYFTESFRFLRTIQARLRL